MDLTTLAELLKLQLNITWSDTVTDAKLTHALEAALPSLCAKVGLVYNYEDDMVTEQDGAVVDLVTPSQLRHLAVVYAAYIFDQQGHLFDANYRIELNACRQYYEVKAIAAAQAADADTEDDDGTATD
ncbi:MAG: hypothetical protein LUC39_01695 [Clostridiales bacterium]|nr:hypothetical protein [Clostridiales bacterium]